MIVVRNGAFGVKPAVFAGAPGFGLPGGAAEAGETLEQAAVREVEEEAGLRVYLSAL